MRRMAVVGAALGLAGLLPVPASADDARLLYLAARALGDEELVAEALDAAGGS